MFQIEMSGVWHRKTLQYLMLTVMLNCILGGTHALGQEINCLEGDSVFPLLGKQISYEQLNPAQKRHVRYLKESSSKAHNVSIKKIRLFSWLKYLTDISIISDGYCNILCDGTLIILGKNKQIVFADKVSLSALGGVIFSQEYIYDGKLVEYFDKIDKASIVLTLAIMRADKKSVVLIKKHIFTHAVGVLSLQGNESLQNPEDKKEQAAFRGKLTYQIVPLEHPDVPTARDPRGECGPFKGMKYDSL